VTQTRVAAEVAGTRRPTPARIVAIVAAVAGLATSVYLTVEHYSGGTSFACPENSAVNCLKVTTSKWAVLAGVPVAVLGLAYFVVVTALMVAPVRAQWIGTVRMGLAGLGVLFALFLVYVELFEVDAICLWCTVVHVCTLVLFAATAWDAMTARR
jgi:uncharacterized membrane protein